MFPTPRSKFVEEPSQSNRTDTRLHHRYPIALDLQYKVLSNEGRVERYGFGRTVNFSSGGILFEAKEIIETHDFLDDTNRIVLEIILPFMLSNVCASKLLVRGRIVRIDGERLAVKIDYREFRTAGFRGPINVPGNGRGAQSG